jgi:hypothetical protein
MLSDTFAGIAPSCVPAFVLAELAGAALALLASHLLGHPGGPATAQEPTNA